MKYHAKYLTSAAALGLWMTSASPAMAHHVTVAGPSNNSGAVTTISPAAPGRKTLTLSADFYLEDYDAFSDQQLGEFAEIGVDGVHNTDSAYISTLSAEYGVSDRLSVSLSLPFVIRTGIREVDHHQGDADGHDAHPEIAQLGSSEGLGDVQLGAKYALFQDEKDGFGLALLAGLSIPMGETRERTNVGNRFETEFQPGSGSWDPKGGLAIGKSFGPLTATANALYTLRTEGSQDTNLGDHLAFNAGLSWRLGKGAHVHDDGTFERHTAIDLIVEMNGEWEERERTGSLKDPNSGGTQIFISPGLRYSSANGWAVYSSVGIPVYEDLNGIQNESDVRFKLGFGLAL